MTTPALTPGEDIGADAVTLVAKPLLLKAALKENPRSGTHIATYILHRKEILVRPNYDRGRNTAHTADAIKWTFTTERTEDGAVLRSQDYFYAVFDMPDFVISHIFTLIAHAGSRHPDAFSRLLAADEQLLSETGVSAFATPLFRELMMIAAFRAWEAQPSSNPAEDPHQNMLRAIAENGAPSFNQATYRLREYITLGVGRLREDVYDTLVSRKWKGISPPAGRELVKKAEGWRKWWPFTYGKFVIAVEPSGAGLMPMWKRKDLYY